jgi:uncharacterized OB-fold protein
MKVSSDSAAVPPLRVPPEVTASAADFWRGGEYGELRIPRCEDCGLWLLPPAPICRGCGSRSLRAEVASGRGVVQAFTVNRQQWNPAGRVEPYLIAFVELPEQEHLRLLTNVVGCAVDEVHVGMEVEVVFEQLEDVWLPLFRPV